VSSLSCRHLWKIYGPRSDVRLRQALVDRADTESVVDGLRQENYVCAACDVSFEVAQGEIFVVMGLSGSGKSTVVRCLSRLVEPTAGEILIEGQNLLALSERELIEIRRHKLGMVFQNFGLLPHLDVLDNVAYPLRVQGMSRRLREERAREMIELVGLAGREDAKPHQLSGGMQQRVGIARSLAVKPDIWFLDEPFSALDPLIRRQMQDEFLRLQAQLRKTIVFITHDFLEAVRLADRIAIMRHGQIVQVGTAADLVLRPANDYVADFTRDVPRNKVLTAGQVMDPPEANGDGRRIEAGAPLDEVMRLLAERRDPLDVADGSGAIVGQVSSQSVIRALAGEPASR